MTIDFYGRVIIHHKNSSKLSALPLEGGGLGRGCFIKDIFNTLPSVPSPQGRGVRCLVPKALWLRDNLLEINV
jgi:hypothetical protein